MNTHFYVMAKIDPLPKLFLQGIYLYVFGAGITYLRLTRHGCDREYYLCQQTPVLTSGCENYQYIVTCIWISYQTFNTINSRQSYHSIAHINALSRIYIIASMYIRQVLTATILYYTFMDTITHIHRYNYHISMDTISYFHGYNITFSRVQITLLWIQDHISMDTATRASMSSIFLNLLSWPKYA